MSDPEIIQSPLSKTVSVEGESLHIEIYRLAHTEWSLEVVDENGTSTVWEDTFSTDFEAHLVAMKAIEEEGLSAFKDSSNVIPFRRH
jgi:hypothetical protein